MLQWVRDRFGARIEPLATAGRRATRSASNTRSRTRRRRRRRAAGRAAAGSATPRCPARLWIARRAGARVPAAAPPPPAPPAAARASPTRRASTRPSSSPRSSSGKANQLARAAGLQVADHPTSYNPLFVYGGVGLGKTHLIQAIGNHILAGNPAAKIRYIHAETYVSDVVRAYQHKAFDDFKRHYRSLDLLLIDDIQFFGGKSRTQEEFFYLFNTLIEAHKQVVITCDTYPKEIAGIEERLISRFGWGLTVALEPPELEMRVAILLAKAHASRACAWTSRSRSSSPSTSAATCASSKAR